jgi:hypothetical protein
MKRTTIAATVGCAAMMTGALGLGFASHVNADASRPQIQMDQRGRDDQGDRNRRERHPEMRAALNSLREAESSLVRADRDFRGHRAKALKLTRDAIKEVELGLRSD